MRRTIVLVATMALTLMVASGVALAVTRIGTDGSDTLKGTRGSDQLLGKGGSDRINGQAGTDTLLGGPGGDLLIDGPLSESAVDTLYGGAGNDTIVTYNVPAARDIISCGADKDYASVDRKDIVGGGCETVALVTASGGPID
jgi:hypothetical protein